MRRLREVGLRGALVSLLALSLTACGSERNAPEPPAAPLEGAPSVASEEPVREAAPPRLIILISLDTLRADHLGLFGYDRPTSPFLDQLGREGVVFEDVSATAPWTLPSHASLLTGLYPLHHQVIQASGGLPREIRTLASMLEGRGYETAAVVNSTWLRREKYGLTREFQRYLWVQESASRRAPSTWVTDQAIEWLKDLRGGRMFLFVHYYDVHADYASEPRYEDLFVTPYGGPVDGSARQLTQAETAEGLLRWCRRSLGDARCDRASDASGGSSRVHFDEPAVRHLEQLYDAGIRQLDAELGRLLSALRRMDLLDQALLVVTADHGEEFMEHGRVSHFFTTYQEVLHVPLILRGPGIPAGVRISTPVSLVDLAPTLLELVGAAPPRPLDGLDLAPLWHDGDRKPFEDRLIFGEGSGGELFGGAEAGVPVYRSVRKGRYKLVYSAVEDRYGLYDLERDPHERVDVSASQPGLVAELRDRMRERYEGGVPEIAPGDEVELDSEDIERLRALGYVP